MRAFRALPVAGADEDFAVALALFAMKLVNRHEEKITRPAKSSSLVLGFRLFFQRPAIRLWAWHICKRRLTRPSRRFAD